MKFAAIQVTRSSGNKSTPGGFALSLVEIRLRSLTPPFRARAALIGKLIVNYETGNIAASVRTRNIESRPPANLTLRHLSLSLSLCLFLFHFRVGTIELSINA